MTKTILVCVILMASCVSKNSTLEPDKTRTFQFTYTVYMESTDKEKLELWIPVPQSNEVQTISNLEFNTNGLEYSIEEALENLSNYIFEEHFLSPVIHINVTPSFQNLYFDIQEYLFLLAR